MPQQPAKVPLPHLTQPRPTGSFPILALIAPIIAAVMMWAFMRSPFVLVFAVLGPAMALATMGDSRRRARRDMREQYKRFDDEYKGALFAIDEAHDRERSELSRKAPFLATVVSAPIRDAERWRAEPNGELLVRVGSGRIPSCVQLDEDRVGADSSHHAPSRARRSRESQCHSISDLRDRARTIDDAPVVVDARYGIGIYGARVGAAAMATSLVVQLATALSPAHIDFVVTSDLTGIFTWTTVLPHSDEGDAADTSVNTQHLQAGVLAQIELRSRSGLAPVVVSISDDEHSLPRECRVIIMVSGSRAYVVRHPGRSVTQAFTPDFTSDREARRCAETLRMAAIGVFAPGAHALPVRVALRDLLEREDGPFADDNAVTVERPDLRSSRDSLMAIVGIGVRGPVNIDLVRDGPHAIVGGTTGSGKSEVLVSWILALAARYSPDQLNFLLVDFKGGAAFTPVQGLPHTVGVLTDLDETAARRAILSLRAELRRREQALADAAVKSIDELPHDVHLPRLLIVVDEFAVMATSFPDVHDLFTDVAARGRSLGIHLILCTQRPSGTIRDAVLANCALRVSLRVNNAADSVAVVGTPDAAKIAVRSPGRGLLQRAGNDVEPVQWALAGVGDARAIEKLTPAGSVSVHRPWLDPLPERLDYGSLPKVTLPALVFGLADIPEEQRRESAIYDPVADGNLFVIGGHRSGKSTVLSTLMRAATDSVMVPSHVEGAWDVVTETLALARKGAGPSLVLVDDLDLVLSSFSQEYEAEFVDRLLSLAQEGPHGGTALVVTARALRGRVQAVFAQCASTLVLKMRDKQEHVLVGGEAGNFSSRLPPGGGQWRGYRVQVCVSEPVSVECPMENPSWEWQQGGSLVVISAHPETVRSRLERVGQVSMIDDVRLRSSSDDAVTIGNGASSAIFLGHPDAWLSAHTLLGSLRSRSPLVFHDCSLTEFRSIARIRELPPPLESAHDKVIVVHPDGRMQRSMLPA